jgi:hypothetical protein
MAYRYTNNGPVHILPDHPEVKREIACEAEIAAKKLATKDWNEEQHIRESGELKAAMIAAESALADRWDAHIKYSLKIAGARITSSPERQLFASIYAATFYAEYHKRIDRLQAQAAAAWEAHEMVANR